MRRSLHLALLLAALGGAGSACKVPLSDINAAFVISDSAWFEVEETLFVFYELHAEQGIGPKSVLEIRYATDDGVVPWTEVDQIEPVHTHVPVDCGFDSLCGSASLHVWLEPRDVELRLRYHREGTVSLSSRSLLNVVGPGPAHTHRSLLIYGVFDETNRALQWRARHRFPTIRNEEAQRLGLRRRFQVEAQRFGDSKLDPTHNPYLYGADCPAGLSDLGWPEIETDARAIFEPEDLPAAASGAPVVCGKATVHDATGAFATDAVARKNPEVRPAFPVLRSPIRDAIPIKYLLSICDRRISADHLAMQRQRLLLGDAEPVCIDHWESGALVDELVIRMGEDIERVRAEGRDMVLALALHHDAPDLREVIEEALERTLATEEGRSTPRVAGAFVYDSYNHAVTTPYLGQRVIWCPAGIPAFGDGGEGEGEEGEGGGEAGEGEGEEGKGEGEGDDDKGGEWNAGNLARLVCLVAPDNPNLSLGPFEIGLLPILSPRERYLDFIDTYSDDQAGRMRSLTFRVPELPPAADHVPVPPFGVATFLNDEVITADKDDAFSFCETDEFPGFVFRSAFGSKLMPIEDLPEWHASVPEETYEIGIVWDFPYLLHLTYEAIAAIAVSAFSASLPFGIAVESEEDYGSEVWLSEELIMEETLTQCRRFCDHPTFDSARVYQVAADFRTAYQHACYVPDFPERGDSGFPRDP